MSGDSRSRIMGRVRSSCAGNEAAVIDQARDALGCAPSALLPHPDTCTAFMANVLRNQGTLDVVPDRSTAVKMIGQYVYQHYRSHRLVAGNDPRLAAMPWRDGGVLPRFGELEPGEQVALSYAQWGVAETGATVFLSGKHNPSRNNLLPERHLVLLDAQNVLPDLETLWQQVNASMAQGSRPRALYCVAGPSSTGDIEGQIVYGAHGPRAWHVVLLGDISPEQEAAARALHGGEESPAPDAS